MEYEIANYRKLKVWRKSFSLSLQIYELSKQFPTDERFGLVSQMRRSSVSVVSNIAEGSGRLTAGEKKNFYGIAFGSITELQTQILLCSSLGYLSNTEELVSTCDEIQKMLQGLIKSTN